MSFWAATDPVMVTSACDRRANADRKTNSDLRALPRNALVRALSMNAVAQAPGDRKARKGGWKSHFEVKHVA